MNSCPIFKETINNFIDSNDAWKIQLTLKLLFMSSNDRGKEIDMYLKIENVIVMTGSNTKQFMENYF